MKTPDKYDEMAAIAGKAGGLDEKQWPGLAIILRSVSRDAIEECAVRVEYIASEYAKAIDRKFPGGEVGMVSQSDFLRWHHQLAAAVRSLKGEAE